MLPAYELLSDQVITTRKSNHANVAQQRLATESITLVRDTTELLNMMSANQDEFLDPDPALVTHINNVAIGVAVELIIAISLATWGVSSHSESRLAEPITMLSISTALLASG